MLDVDGGRAMRGAADEVGTCGQSALGANLTMCQADVDPFNVEVCSGGVVTLCAN